MAALIRIPEMFLLQNSLDNKALTAIMCLRRFCSTMVEHDVRKDTQKEKISKAMKAYLERAQAHEQFLKQEQHAYNVGRRHLANMMGKNAETFTQDDIDESVRYLFPSALYEPKARPLLKPPEEVHPKTKAAEFDKSGRPYHYLFYTTRPNFSSLLKECADILTSLDAYEDKLIRKQQKPDPTKKFNPMGSVWINQEAVENMVVEKLVEVEYKKFISVLERILAHPCSGQVNEFLLRFRRQLMKQHDNQNAIAEPMIADDGRKYVTFKKCIRKSTRGEVTVTVPGTGKFLINKQDISYFSDVQARKQVLFPLILTGMEGKVDIEAKMEFGGQTGQAGATRYGIAMALRSFLPPQTVEEMRLAGLLQTDFRRRERKKPGQEGARRKYTWKKR